MVESAVLTGQAMSLLRLSQEEFAAALNIRQPTVSRWVRGIRNPPPPIHGQLTAILATANLPATVLGVDRRGRAVIAPATRWDVVLRPAGPFRLPQHVEWSGGSRWRDATDTKALLEAYALVLHSASVPQIASWVPMETLSERLNDLPVPRAYLPLWRQHLDSLAHAAVS